jgi:putative transposase
VQVFGRRHDDGIDVLMRPAADIAHVENFNATVRLECLGRFWFLNLDDAREKVEEWRIEYNEVRPHSAIGDRAPLSLIHQQKAPRT